MPICTLKALLVALLDGPQNPQSSFCDKSVSLISYINWVSSRGSHFSKKFTHFVTIPITATQQGNAGNTTKKRGAKTALTLEDNNLMGLTQTAASCTVFKQDFKKM